MSSQEDIQDLSTKSNNSGDTGYTGDKLSYIIEEKTDFLNNTSDSASNICINCSMPTDSRIGYNHPFYYCKGHPKVQNIHLEVIESHHILAKNHYK